MARSLDCRSCPRRWKKACSVKLGQEGRRQGVAGRPGRRGRDRQGQHGLQHRGRGRAPQAARQGGRHSEARRPGGDPGRQGRGHQRLLAQVQGGGQASKSQPQNGAKPEAKNDAKAEGKPEGKNGAKPEGKPEAKIDAKDQKQAPVKPLRRIEPAQGEAQAAGGRVLASPLAKTLAIELGVDLRNVHGLGAGRTHRRARRARCCRGRATRRREPTLPRRSRPTAAGGAGGRGYAGADVRPTWSTRIGRCPTCASASRSGSRRPSAIPHFYLTRSFDVEPLLDFRERLNALLGDRGKVVGQRPHHQGRRPGAPARAGRATPRSWARRSATSAGSTSASPSRSRTAWSRR